MIRHLDILLLLPLNSRSGSTRRVLSKIPRTLRGSEGLSCQTTLPNAGSEQATDGFESYGGSSKPEVRISPLSTPTRARRPMIEPTSSQRIVVSHT